MSRRRHRAKAQAYNTFRREFNAMRRELSRKISVGMQAFIGQPLTVELEYQMARRMLDVLNNYGPQFERYTLATPRGYYCVTLCGDKLVITPVWNGPEHG